MSRRAAAGAALALAATAVAWSLAGPAAASTYEGTVDFTCTNADASGSGAHTLDRDNTGAGQESLNVTVTDGLGTVIYELDFQNVLGTFAGGIGDFFYTTPPAANPLTFTLTSIAGNGLPEQVDVTATGLCPGLPPVATAPAEAVQGDTVTVSGEGCPEGPVTVRLLATAGDTEALAVAEGLAGSDFAFTVGLTVPADAPPGALVVEVACGDEAEPTSEAAVLDLTVAAQATTTSTSTTTTTAPATTTTTPPATGPVVAQPTFTG